MTNLQIICPDAVARLDAARPILARGGWGDGVEAVCLMSALVPGARNAADCETAGWPGWLTELIVGLYDANTGSSNEQAAADRWAVEIATAVARPVDYAMALHRLFISVLQLVEGYDMLGTVTQVIALHERGLAGDTPSDEEWAAACNAARAAACNAAWAAARAATRAAQRAALVAALAKSAAKSAA